MNGDWTWLLFAAFAREISRAFVCRDPWGPHTEVHPGRLCVDRQFGALLPLLHDYAEQTQGLRYRVLATNHLVMHGAPVATLRVNLQSIR